MEFLEHINLKDATQIVVVLSDNPNNYFNLEQFCLLEDNNQIKDQLLVTLEILINWVYLKENC